MRRRTSFPLLLLASLLLALALPLAAQKKSEKKAAAQASAGRAERGVFRVYAGGKAVGAETFEISTASEGTEARAEIHLSVEGQKVSQTARLTLGPAGLPRSYEWNEESPKKMYARVRFQEGKAIIEFPLETGSMDQREFFFTSPDVVVLDNNVFHHFIFLLQHYDFAKGGRQPVHILIPQEVTPGIVYLESHGPEEVPVGNSKRKLERIAVVSEDNEISVWVDEQKRVVKIGVPQNGVEVVRE